MKKVLEYSIRGSLTLLLIYWAYTETGVGTALNLFFIFIAIEVMVLWIRKINEVLKL